MNTKAKLQLRIMLLSLRKSGFRSLLALGAVGLGIASMMVMLALSTGARLELEAITDRIGRNLFMIAASQVLSQPGRGGGWYASTRLDLADVKLMNEQIHGIRTIVPILEGNLQTKFNREDLVTSVRGVTPNFPEVRNFELEDGRFLDEQDSLARSRVAVVGSFVAKRLNDGFSMVGETLWIVGFPFQVVGQLKEKGNTDGQNEDDQVLVPLETARRRLFNVDYLSRLLVQVEDQGQMSEVQREAREVLRSRHALDRDVKDDFDILSLLRANQIRNMNSAFLEGLSQLFAAVTLAIGGAGVLAVTYLNVKDRTSEIGLRMAIGARRRDIASLFVAEACLLSVLGGLSGVLVGGVGIVVLKRATGWQMAVDLRGVAIPLLVSALLGVGFGVFPAIKASKVTPVDALRDA
ncbi:MAG: ABC transporter permease [Acidobacteria bacterium]|nr:ABC transporter permease [Acidobacteriota bacterium]